MRFIKILIVLSLLFCANPIQADEEEQEFVTPYGGYVLELIVSTPYGPYIYYIYKFPDPYWGIYLCNTEKENIVNRTKNYKKHDIVVVCAQYREKEL